MSDSAWRRIFLPPVRFRQSAVTPCRLQVIVLQAKSFRNPMSPPDVSGGYKAIAKSPSRHSGTDAGNFLVDATNASDVH